VCATDRSLVQRSPTDCYLSSRNHKNETILFLSAVEAEKSICICVHTHAHTHMCVCVHIYIYIYILLFSLENLHSKKIHRAEII
jgi:hypothetical protein